MLPTADINVTSLVDVAFVLLIIFMITAPMMQGGVPVELPKAEGRPLAPREGIIVTVDRRGQIYVDQTRVSYDDFRAAFRALVAKRGTSNVYLRSDRRASYGDVVRVLAAMQAAGVASVGLTTEDEEVVPGRHGRSPFRAARSGSGWWEPARCTRAPWSRCCSRYGRCRRPPRRPTPWSWSARRRPAPRRRE